MPVFQVRYPSGKRFRVEGYLWVIPGIYGPLIPFPHIVPQPEPPFENILQLDPRAIITSNGRRVFTGCTTAELEAAQAQTE